jgi:hypothetical protein
MNSPGSPAYIVDNIFISIPKKKIKTKTKTNREREDDRKAPCVHYWKYTCENAQLKGEKRTMKS